MARARSSWAESLSDEEFALARKNGLYKRDGSNIWWARINGKRTSLTTEVLEDAVAKLNLEKHEVWKEQEMGIARKYTWAEACTQREKEVSRSMKSWETEAQRLRWWWPHLKGVKDLNQITRKMIADIIESGTLRSPEPVKYGPGVVSVDLSGPASCNTTANKYVRAVATILNAAEREWGWGNRAPTLKTYDDGLPRDAAPTPYELLKLVERMPEHTRDMMVYGAMTMHRLGNVTGLKWSMIDWEKRAVAIAGRLTKTGKQIYVPLNSVALGVLKRRFDATNGMGVSTRHPEYVFTYQGNRIKQVLTRAFRKARAGLEMVEVCFHTTRHCGQSWLAEEGVSMELRARLGGWKVKGMGAMDDYTHLNIEPLRPTAEILAGKWNAAVALRQASVEESSTVPVTVSSQTRGSDVTVEA